MLISPDTQRVLRTCQTWIISGRVDLPDTSIYGRDINATPSWKRPAKFASGETWWTCENSITISYARLPCRERWHKAFCRCEIIPRNAICNMKANWRDKVITLQGRLRTSIIFRHKSKENLADDVCT